MVDLDGVLSSFTRFKGVTVALVVGQDGLPLHSVTAKGVDESEVDVLGALAASGLVAAEEIGEQTRRGVVRQAIYEYERGVVVIEPLGSALLVIATDVIANLGLLRLQARRVNAELQTTLADM